MTTELEYQEIADNLIDTEILKERLSVGKVVMLRGNGRNILIGDGCLVKVNTSIGVSSNQSLNEEIEKLRSITSCSYSPDIIMDLSIMSLRNKLYNMIPDFHSGPLGTLPHYRVHLGVSSPIKEEELFSIMEEQAASGVTFFTIHPTPTQELIALARQTRSTPFTSRGGGIIIRDMRMKKRDLNVFSENFDEILNLCKKYDVSLNIGTAFRPTSIMDALDEVHTKELLEQKKYIDLAKKKGVRVAFEAVGHATLNRCLDLSKKVASMETPMMALGPIPTDKAIGFDHISNAIGAAFLSFFNGCHVINSVTREEHTGNVPSCESILEGLKASRVAAHIANVALFPEIANKEAQIGLNRAQNYTCVIDGGLFNHEVDKINSGCTRCGKTCPLLVTKQEDVRYDRNLR